MLTQDKVEFYQGSQAEYDATTKSANKLYFTSDTHRIYKGEDLYSGTGGGGAAVQSDYTMNDPADPSYIKNREFYTSEETTKYNGRYVVVTQDILDSSMEGIAFSISDKPLGMVENQTYTVKFNDDASVSGTAVNVSEMLDIDTVGIMNTEVEPYYYVIDKCKLQVVGSDTSFVKDDNSVTYYYGTGFAVGSTIQVIGDGIEDTEITQTTIHKLPEKYLTQSDWDISDTNSAAYVKNRPLYSEVLNGRSITFTSDHLIDNMYGSLPSIGLVAGETYTLVWNDIEYSDVTAITNEAYPNAVILLCPDSSGPQIYDGLTVKDEALVEDATKALVILGSEAVPVGTKISIYGKNLTAPTSPQTITTTAGTGQYHASYGNSLGLIEGNSYILTINGSEYTYTAENLRKNSEYTNCLSKDVIGLKVSDFGDMVILDQYKLPSDSSLIESDFINGTVDSNVCSIYYYTGIAISMAGEFATPSFENFHKIDENYLPDTVATAPFHKEITFSDSAVPITSHTPSDAVLSNYFKDYDENRICYWADFVGGSKTEFELKYSTESDDMVNGANEAIGGITFTAGTTDLYNGRFGKNDIERSLVYFKKDSDENLNMYMVQENYRAEDISIPDNLQYLDIDVFSTSIDHAPLGTKNPQHLYVTPYYNPSAIILSLRSDRGDYITTIAQSVNSVSENTEGLGAYPKIVSGIIRPGTTYTSHEFAIAGNGIGTTDTATVSTDNSAHYLTALMHNHERIICDNNQITWEGYTIGRMMNKCPIENPNITCDDLKFDKGFEGYKNFNIGTPLGLIEGKYYTATLTFTNEETGYTDTVTAGPAQAENLKNDPDIGSLFSYDCIGFNLSGFLCLADSSSYDSTSSTIVQSSEGFVVYAIASFETSSMSATITGPGIVGTKVVESYSRPSMPRYVGQIPTSGKVYSKDAKYSDLELNYVSGLLPGDKIILHGEYKTEW